ncbi:hypothetical protein E4H04_10520 [Candidatus Bathyarchaeota archaeon]|nr:MAG: hypothetical protein E4H04_10520 [Candidatus Bathyarchaeota archaeon]
MIQDYIELGGTRNDWKDVTFVQITFTSQNDGGGNCWDGFSIIDSSDINPSNIDVVSSEDSSIEEESESTTKEETVSDDPFTGEATIKTDLSTIEVTNDIDRGINPIYYFAMLCATIVIAYDIIRRR